jgi:hypothetical protein
MHLLPFKGQMSVLGYSCIGHFDAPEHPTSEPSAEPGSDPREAFKNIAEDPTRFRCEWLHGEKPVLCSDALCFDGGH